MSWLWKLISGWLPIGVNSDGQSKSFDEWAGKIIWVVGIVLAVLFATNLIDKVFEHFFPAKPNVITIGSGGTQIINQAEPRDMMGVGCSAWRGYGRLGIKAK